MQTLRICTLILLGGDLHGRSCRRRTPLASRWDIFTTTSATSRRTNASGCRSEERPPRLARRTSDPVSRRVRRADERRVVRRHRRLGREPRGVPRAVVREVAGGGLEGPAAGAVSGRGLGDKPRRRTDRAVRRHRDEHDVHARRRARRIAGAERHNQPITVPIIAYHIHLYLPEGIGGEGQGLVREDVRRRARHAVALPGRRSAGHQPELFEAASSRSSPTAGGCSTTSASK